MQHLHMSEENQDMVRETLKELHGGEDLDVLWYVHDLGLFTTNISIIC